MKIVHVVTLVSANGAFGGPVSVALQQSEELARRGHEVRVLAGWDGEGRFDAKGVAVSLHRVRRVAPGGFSGLVAPGLLGELRRLAGGVDVVHVHLARDLISLPAARLVVSRKRHLVTQTHGMVMPDCRPKARVMDRAMTRRVLLAAQPATVLTEIEREGLQSVAGPEVNTVLLANGISVPSALATVKSSDVPTVLFCARLHPRKGVLRFAAMAQRLISAGTRANFVVAGPDEGDLSRLRDFVANNDLGNRISYVGALAPQDVASALRAAAVFVLPSEREPFPMTLLEAMAEGTPCVITTGCMISAQIAAAGGAVVTDGSVDELARAVGRFVNDPQYAADVGSRGRQAARTKFVISAVVDQLELLYAG